MLIFCLQEALLIEVFLIATAKLSIIKGGQHWYQRMSCECVCLYALIQYFLDRRTIRSGVLWGCLSGTAVPRVSPRGLCECVLTQYVAYCSAALNRELKLSHNSLPLYRKTVLKWRPYTRVCHKTLATGTVHKPKLKHLKLLKNQKSLLFVPILDIFQRVFPSFDSVA